MIRGQSRPLLALECAMLFLLAPLLMRSAMYDHKVPLFWALLPAALVIIVLVWRDQNFNFRARIATAMPAGTLRSILVPFAIGVPVVIAAVAEILPDHLFNLPRERTKLWAKMLVLYPFTSVLAQEAVYRVFFFHRYGQLFPSRWAIVVASAAAFAVSHVVFRNWIAVALTFAAGLLLAWRYQKTASFKAVWLEHTLWGWLLFTCGLGVYFLTGPKNPAW